MENNRTANSIRNAKTGALVQIINKLMAFIVRTVFIKTLNAEYLGVNGLFTNILTMLSFTELGIGTAIVFNMYKPIAKDDKEKIKSLLLLYKKCYIIVGVIVAILGVCIVPWMKYIIKDVPKISENIILIYFLFLFNTSSSYFFTYKKSIITAYQQQSVINNIDSIFYLFKSLIEIILLVCTRNYILYLTIEIMSTLIENIVLSIIANKKFPFIKEKNIKKLPQKEKRNIFENVKSLIVYKIGEVILNGTDNILISTMVNVESVGLCSNYTLIIQAVKSIISSALSGVTASVGNLNALDNAIKKEKIFYQLTFINYIVYSFCGVAFIILLNPFIELWLGDEYVLGIGICIALVISFWIEGMRIPGFIFRTTLGLFNKGKIAPYIGAIANIVVSVLLCNKYGVIGIFIGTSVSQLLSYSWIDPYLIHKYAFKTSVTKYMKKYLIYILGFIINILVTIFISNQIHMINFTEFISKGLLVCVLPNIINLLLFHNTQEFKELRQRTIRITSKNKV